MDAQIQYLRDCLRTGADKPLTETAHEYFTTAITSLGKDAAQVEFGDVAADAAEAGREDIVEGLLSAGCELTSSILEGAKNARSIAVFEVLLHYGREQKKWDINTPWRNIDDPECNDADLMIGQISPDWDLTCWFLEQGAKLDIIDRDDLTPLSLAVQHAPKENIELLLEHGGNVEEGWLLNQAVARESEHVQVMHLLLEKLEEREHNVVDWLNTVKYSGNDDLYQFHRNSDLGTPLHDAATQGEPDLVLYLLRSGADRDILDSNGLTAEACAEQCLEQVEDDEQHGRICKAIEYLQDRQITADRKIRADIIADLIGEPQRNDSVYSLDDNE